MLTRVTARADRLLGLPGLKRAFRRRMGYSLNLRDPQSFNEKMQWRKLYDRNPLFPLVADKYRVREFVSSVLGEDQTAALKLPVLHVTNRPSTIPFDRLPGNVAVKANHGCGWNVFLMGEGNERERIVADCKNWLGRTHGVRGHEWAYQEIDPLILVEPLLTHPDGTLADDLKFHIFAGTCRMVGLIKGRGGDFREGFFDRNWNQLPVEPRKGRPLQAPQRPLFFDRALSVAEELGSHFDHIRVDFLITNETFALGELTIYDGSGFVPWKPEAIDFELGTYWKLPTS